MLNGTISEVTLERPFRHGGGKRWVADLPAGFGGQADTSDAPARSTLLLQEDGKSLGPRHAIHADIESEGSGRYSHWNGSLFFSTSDGSDPSTNGRHYSVAVGVSTPLALGLGTCHLHDALARLYAQGRIYPVWPDPLVSCSPREALQLVEFHNGRPIPQWLSALTSAKTWQRPMNFKDADVVFLEVGASIDIAYGSHWLPRSCVVEALLEPISGLGRVGRRAARRWFHLGLMMQNEPVRAECVEQLIGLIPEIEGDQRLLRDIVENARGHSQDAHEIVRTITRIVDLLEARAICVVSAQNAFTQDGRPVTWPGNFRAQLDTICRDIGLPLLHPAHLVAQYGRAFSLQPDLHHFTPQFLSILGDEMLAVVSGRLPSRTSPAEPAKQLMTMAP